MIPKIGDIVKLNHDFLKVYINKGNKYLRGEVWKEKFRITGIAQFGLGLKVSFEYNEDSKYVLAISHNGEFLSYFHEYKGIQAFIPVFETNIYCSCGGPRKKNSVLGKKFYVCTTCKKEVI